jgi:hypothetical protein
VQCICVYDAAARHRCRSAWRQRLLTRLRLLLELLELGVLLVLLLAVHSQLEGAPGRRTQAGRQRRPDAF